MKTTTKTLLAGSFILVACQAFAASKSKNDKPSTKPAKPRIEVCFVLDTTGSMSGLIEGAKQKIWSIANEIIAARPTPEIRVGLVGYRDRGDEYVVKTFSLTNDIDAVYAKLRAFRADGGGDTPESVNEAPPHMDYANSPKYPEICKTAMKKDLIINTVQCGSIPETTPVWQEIAK